MSAIVRMHREAHHPARRYGRPDRPQLESAKRLGRHQLGRLLIRLLISQGREGRENWEENQQETDAKQGEPHFLHDRSGANHELNHFLKAGN
jgi:hypothetical protein